jgi:serine/threonine-protein kinase HipA
MSAWPVIGKGAHHFQWPKVSLAMAVRSKSTHYRLKDIQRRHWNTVAKRNGMGQDFETAIQRVVEHTPTVIERVAALLPAGFPEKVAAPILKGLADQARLLESQRPLPLET